MENPPGCFGSAPSGSRPGTEATSVPPSFARRPTPASHQGPYSDSSRPDWIATTNDRLSTDVDAAGCQGRPHRLSLLLLLQVNCLRVWGVAVNRRRRPLAGGQSGRGRTLPGLSDNPVVGTATRIASWLSSKSDTYAKSVGNSFHPRTWTFKRMRVLPRGSCPGVVRRSWRRRTW